jgi:hypothetical protein
MILLPTDPTLLPDSGSLFPISPTNYGKIVMAMDCTSRGWGDLMQPRFILPLTDPVIRGIYISDKVKEAIQRNDLDTLSNLIPDIYTWDKLLLCEHGEVREGGHKPLKFYWVSGGFCFKEEW